MQVVLISVYVTLVVSCIKHSLGRQISFYEYEFLSFNNLSALDIASEVNFNVFIGLALTLAGGHGGNGSLSDGESNNSTVSSLSYYSANNSIPHCSLSFITLQIFVGGLDADVTEEDLMQPFSQFGEVVSVKIPVGKGCGFVQFANRY